MIVGDSGFFPSLSFCRKSAHRANKKEHVHPYPASGGCGNVISFVSSKSNLHRKQGRET